MYGGERPDPQIIKWNKGGFEEQSALTKYGRKGKKKRKNKKTNADFLTLVPHTSLDG